MPAMQHGATIVTMDQWEPAAAIDLIERERINIMGEFRPILSTC